MSGGDWKEMLVGAQDGDLNLVKYYIEQGIDPNYQHPELLTTPLIEAITYERPEVVKYLLTKGADPTLMAGFSTDTPLKVARQTKNKHIIQILKEAIPQKPSFLDRLKNAINVRP